MTDEQKAVFEALTDIQLIAVTLYGEARGEPPEGKRAVAEVILNRAQKWGKTIKNVCLAKNQFSCFLTNDPNFPKLLGLAQDFPSDNAALNACLEAAEGAYTGDRTIGDATFYRVKGTKNAWFDGAVARGKLVKTGEIKHHEFFKEA